MPIESRELLGNEQIKILSITACAALSIQKILDTVLALRVQYGSTRLLDPPARTSYEDRNERETVASVISSF